MFPGLLGSPLIMSSLRSWIRTCSYLVVPDLPHSLSVNNQVSPLSCLTPSVITSPKSLAYILKRWLSLYRMSLTHYHYHLASNVHFHRLAGQKRKPNKKLKNRTLNCEISTEFQSYHLVFVDESRCDKRIRYR
jgi:hypothetical protein